MKVNKDSVESCYTPIIQSGGKYDIKVSAQSNNDNMSFDIIICSLGARYKSYCANISRTYMIDPLPKIEDTYTLLISLYDKCLESMVLGNELKDVYANAKSFLSKKNREDLISHLPKSLGFAIGLEFRDPTLLLNAINTTRFTEGMVFCLSVGFQEVPLLDSDKKASKSGSVAAVQNLNSFALLISDTVVIQKSGVPDILTKTSKSFGDVSYNITSEGNTTQPEGGSGKGEEEEGGGGDEKEGVVRTSLRAREDKAAVEQAAQKRAERQSELMERKLAEARRRMLASGGEGVTDSLCQ